MEIRGDERRSEEMRGDEGRWGPEDIDERRSEEIRGDERR